MRDLEKNMPLNSGKASKKPDEQDGSNVYVVDNGPQSSSTLLPMLVAGIVLITVGMIVVMVFF